MRSLHADLISKQVASSIEPAMACIFTSQDGGTTYDYSFDPDSTTNRLEEIMYREEPFADYAQFTLRNDDLVVPDLVGYWVDLGIGAKTDSGLRYGTYPRLWVKRQHTLSGGSKNGKKDLKVILELEGVWAILREEYVLIGSAPFHNDNYSELTGKTIYELLKYLIETSLYAITGSIYQFSLDALGDQDDGIINSLILEPTKDPENPLINKNAPERYDTFVDVFEWLFTFTGCYLRAGAGLTFKIIYPQSTDSVNETYYSSMSDGHVFYENTERQFIKIPTRVIVYSDQSADKDWSSFIRGDAYNADDWDLSQGVYIGEYVPSIEFKIDSDGFITNEATANALASHILNKHTAETFAGRTVVPHDARVELFDRIRVVDTRQ